ncbi:MAG: DUF4136 domain-containing protein [Candidatus Acidiferrum sp.]
MLHSHPAKSTKWILTAAALLAVVFIAGCDEHVTSERNPEVPIPKHATWAWRPAEAQPAASDSHPITSRDEPAQGHKMAPETEASNEILRGQIRVAITKALADKGFKEVSDPKAAAFLVDFHIAVKDQSARVPVGYAGGYPGVVCGPYGCVQSWGWGPPALGYQNISFRAGTMVFDFLQAPTKNLAFRSIGSKPVKSGYTTFRQSDVHSLVNAVLWKLSAGQ